jgi:hypothetical protein
MFNIVARILAPTRAEQAAIIQGAAHTFATTTTTPAAAQAPLPSKANSTRPKRATTSFVTDLRRQTTELLQDALGQQRLHELRAQGQAMNSDDAVAYALEQLHNLPAHSGD